MAITKGLSMKRLSMKNGLVKNQLGVADVAAQGATVRPWAAACADGVNGVHIAPTSAVHNQDAAVMTPAVDAAPRKDVFARSGIRTEGPPV